jgi:hypothetical protein
MLGDTPGRWPTRAMAAPVPSTRTSMPSVGALRAGIPSWALPTASGWLRARGGLFLGQHLLKQRGEHRLIQRREPQQTRIQTLQLSLREGLEINTRSRVVSADGLPPAQQHLRVTR